MYKMLAGGKAVHNLKILSLLYSRYNPEASYEWWGPSPRLSTGATELRRKVEMVASRFNNKIIGTGSYAYLQG